MSWIRSIEEESATGLLRSLYRRIGGRSGKVPHILKVHGPNPPSLRAHLDLYRVLMFGDSPLSRRQRESIAVVVSAANDCHY